MDVASRWEAPRSLYVHVPFCRSKCAYCDFFSLPMEGMDTGIFAAWVEATLNRLETCLRRFPPQRNPAFDTVYIGGGTPSILPGDQLSRLFLGIVKRAGQPIEWTMEANPESLCDDVLDRMEAAGLTRLSLGIQSLDDEVLRLLDRPARRDACETALSSALSREGLLVSVDLIAGLPRKDALASEARALVDFGVDHLSIYDLVLEEGSPLASRVRAGEVLLPGEDEAASERESADAFLDQVGFRRYEISNFAPIGKECLHNLAYWHMDSYLGIGPGAVSTLQELPDPDSPPGSRGFSLRIEEGRELGEFVAGRQDAAAEMRIEPKDSAIESIMMAMRTVYGLDTRFFEERFGIGVSSLLGQSLEKWKGLLVPAQAWFPADPARLSDAGEGIALGGAGMDILNRFLVDCMLELESKFPEFT